MITKETKIMDVVSNVPDSVKVFQDYGLGCIGCFVANFETLEDGCMVHGIDVDKLVEDLNKVAPKE